MIKEASTGLKYGPPKDDLLLAWKETQHGLKNWRTLAGKLRPPKNSDAHRRLRIMMTLQLVAKKLHRKDCSFWVKNAGRYVSKKLGPVICLSKCGVVKKLQKRRRIQRRIARRTNSFATVLH